MEAKHTTGPLRVSIEGGDLLVVKPVPGAVNDQYYVAMLYQNPDDGDPEANAALFAAAGDLLEALEQTVAELHSMHAEYGDKDNAREHSAGIRMGEAAIARARGEG